MKPITDTRRDPLRAKRLSVALAGATAALALAAVPANSHAEGLYFGGNYAAFQFTDDSVDDEIIKPDGVVLRLGIEPTRVLGLEARGGIGLQSDKRNVSGGSLEFELDELYGGYAKIGLPLGDAVTPYAIGGYTHVKGSATATVLGVSSGGSETWEDESYGAGLDVNLSESLALNVEYMRYLEKDDQELSAVSVGLRSAF